MCREREEEIEVEGSVMFELVVEYRECFVFLLIYKIFKQGFLHDSKRADTCGQWPHQPQFFLHGHNRTFDLEEDKA